MPATDTPPEKLTELLSQKTAEVEVLRRLALEVNSTLDLDRIYETVLWAMDEYFGLRHSIILLLEESNELRVVASRGYENQPLGGTVALGSGVIGTVAKRQRIMRIGNLQSQRSYFSTIRRQMEEAGRGAELQSVVPLPGLADAESQIAIPLTIKDRLVGVLSVESREQRSFSEHEETLVTIVANQAASAIQNAILHATVEKRRQELIEAHDRLKELNENLEARVQARTSELEQANRELRETQTQLVQSGKMASLGMLAAGIAHEINNPIGAIRSNADVERRTFQVLRDLLEQPALSASVGDLTAFQRAVKVFEETNRMTQQASERVIKVIQSLKSFARLDHSRLELLDIHEGLESTLTLLNHLLRDRIIVHRRYGDLPRIRCYASEINQVFANLLTNAVQAIEQSGSISLTTRLASEFAVIEIADTGAGIKPEHLHRIFDPGFTTKGVGVGLGLGLAIAYRIVEKHRGSILVHSILHQGSTFEIRLPINIV